MKPGAGKATGLRFLFSLKPTLTSESTYHVLAPVVVVVVVVVVVFVVVVVDDVVGVVVC